MENLNIPKNYQSALSLHDTQIGIKTVKDFFQTLLAERLNLLRVSAPLFVDPASGLNDNLNGVERPVAFGIKEQNDYEAEIVQSLAKWKRYALKKYGFMPGEGLYTDMSAIRRDEVTDNIHSIYVDQWDWEKIITKEERTLDTLKDVVRIVYKVLRKTEKFMSIQYDYIEEILPHDIFFVTTQELEDMFPDNTPKEREYYIARAKGAVCIMQIGDVMESGERHDGRAPDYDDWSLNIRFWISHWSFPLWVSVWIRTLFFPSFKKPDVWTEPAFPSRKPSLKKSFLLPSAEVSGSPVYVCSSFGKRISARYSVPSGRMILQRKRRAMASIFCKCQASKDRKNSFFK